jgi:hypothetical protein
MTMDMNKSVAGFYKPLAAWEAQHAGKVFGIAKVMAESRSAGGSPGAVAERRGGSHGSERRVIREWRGSGA